MIHLMLFLSLITAQSSISANIEERIANEKVIVSPPSIILNQSRTESEIVVETQYNNPQPLWVDDNIVIDSAYDYQAVTVATDRSSGEIYVVASRRANPGETYKLPCWHSSDGIHWSSLFMIQGTTVNLVNPSLNIFTTADSDYIIVAYERADTTHQPPHEVDVRAYRQAIGATAGTFSDISVISGLDEYDPDLCNSDLRYPSDPWLFCAFVSHDSIAFVRSVDYGLTWTSRQIIGASGTTWGYLAPDCAFGWMSSPDSMFIGVAWQYSNISDGSRELRFRKNTINGTPGHWRSMNYFTSPPDRFDDYPTLQMTHGSYPSAVIFFQRTDTAGTDRKDLYRYFTDDGAETWDTAAHYNSGMSNNKPFALGIDDTLGYYHLVYRDQSGSLRYQRSRYDSTWHAWSQYTYISSGNAWSDGDFPAIGVRNHQPYVCWVDLHSPVDKLKFDAEWLPAAVKEQKTSPLMSLIMITPNPSAGNVKISYQVKQKGNVKISIHNASGRLVNNLVLNAVTIGEHTFPLNCQSLPAGVYFVSVEMPDGILRQHVTIVK
jgi:Secretion system C-terminal sorting domain